METIEFVDADGASTTLLTMRGMSGRFMPPVETFEEQVPERHGSVLRSVRYAARSVVVPVLLDGSTSLDYRTTLRSIARSLNPLRGDGKLVATTDLGVRELPCRYLDGMGFGEEYPTHGMASLMFKAFDPFWQDAEDTTASYEYAAGDAGSWFPMSFPMTLLESQVFASPIIDNTGDVEAWPVWTVRGPMSDLVLANDTTGESLTLAHTVAANHTVIIDTRQSVKSAELNGTVNLYPYLDRSSSLWALQPGENELSVEVGGATVDTLVTLAYRRRWLAA